jgi:MFS family permease
VTRQPAPSASANPRVMHRWTTLPVAYLLFAVMVGTTLPNALWTRFEQQLGISTTTVTVLFASYASAVIVSLLAWGGTSDRIGRRPVLLAALAASAAGSAATLAGGVPALFAGRIFAGVSVGLVSGAAVAFLTDLRGTRGANGAALLATGLTMGGLAVGPLLAGTVTAVAGGSTAAAFAAHLLLLAPAVLAAVVPEPVRARVDALPRPPRLALPSPRRVFLGAALVGFAGNGLLGLFGALTPTLLDQALGLDDVRLAGALGALVFAAAGVAQLATARASGRGRIRVGAWGLAAAIGALAVSLTSASVPWFVLAVVIGGTTGGLCFSGGLAVATQLASPERRGATSSLWFVAPYTGLIGPVVGAGRLVDLLGPTPGVVTIGVALTGLAVVGALIAVPRQRARHA